MPIDEKKNFLNKKFFKKSSWTRGKQLWQSCRLFFEKKKPLFLRSFSKNPWKNKQKLCQNKVMSSKWSFRLVESSVVNLAERKFERRLIIFGWLSKNDVKKNFWQKFCSPQTGLIDKQKAVLTSGLTRFRRNDIQKSLNAQWLKKKNFFAKNSLQSIPLDTW